MDNCTDIQIEGDYDDRFADKFFPEDVNRPYGSGMIRHFVNSSVECTYTQVRTAEMFGRHTLLTAPHRPHPTVTRLQN